MVVLRLGMEITNYHCIIAVDSHEGSRSEVSWNVEKALNIEMFRLELIRYP
jgi:hypothetical protein